MQDGACPVLITLQHLQSRAVNGAFRPGLPPIDGEDCRCYLSFISIPSFSLPLSNPFDVIKCPFSSKNDRNHRKSVINHFKLPILLHQTAIGQDLQSAIKRSSRTIRAPSSGRPMIFLKNAGFRKQFLQFCIELSSKMVRRRDRTKNRTCIFGNKVRRHAKMRKVLSTVGLFAKIRYGYRQTM